MGYIDLRISDFVIIKAKVSKICIFLRKRLWSSD